MTHRYVSLLAAAAVGVALPLGAVAQDVTFDPPRTEWGDPDFSGHYLAGAYQSLETRANDSWEQPEGVNQGQGAAFSRFFAPDPDAPPRRRPTGGVSRGPMVVDPADGRVPLQPWAAEQRNEIMARQDELEHLDRQHLAGGTRGAA